MFSWHRHWFGESWWLMKCRESWNVLDSEAREAEKLVLSIRASWGYWSVADKWLASIWKLWMAGETSQVAFTGRLLASLGPSVRYGGMSLPSPPFPLHPQGNPRRFSPCRAIRASYAREMTVEFLLKLMREYLTFQPFDYHITTLPHYSIATFLHLVQSPTAWDTINSQTSEQVAVLVSSSIATAIATAIERNLKCKYQSTSTSKAWPFAQDFHSPTADLRFRGTRISGKGKGRWGGGDEINNPFDTPGFFLIGGVDDR